MRLGENKVLKSMVGSLLAQVFSTSHKAPLEVLGIGVG